MNYFSHYYVLDNHNRPYYALGSILPDMLRNAKGELSLLEQLDQSTTVNQNLTLGILSHLEVDRRFHNSKFFIDSTRRFAALIRDDVNIGMNRYTQFYAHILLELLIDHVLIQEDRDLVEKFYKQLDAVSEPIIQDYFNHHFPTQDSELFWEKLSKFKSQKFLLNYNELNKVIEYSFYVYEKATKRDVERNELKYYISLINKEMTPFIKQNSRNLFEDLALDYYE